MAVPPFLGYIHFLGSFEVTTVTSKITHQFQGHILVAFFKSFHLICDTTISDHFQKIALGGAHSSPPPGVGGQKFFFHRLGYCKWGVHAKNRVSSIKTEDVIPLCYVQFLGSFEVTTVTSKVTHQFQGHILVAFFKSFHLICNMTIWPLSKNCIGCPFCPLGVGGQIFFSQTRVL